jgi:hypothetical protein
VIDPSRIALIEARLESATPGPWRSTWDDDPFPISDLNEQVVIEAPNSPGADIFARMVVGVGCYDGLDASCTRENAALIAAAPTDLRYLLDAHAALAAEVATLRKRDWAAAHLDHRVALEMVTGDRFCAWLRARGWVERWSRPHVAVFRCRAADDACSAVVFCEPLEDYFRRVGEAIQKVARCANRSESPHVVLSELLPDHGPWEV